MIVILRAATVLGLSVVPVSVEVDVSSGGLPGLTVVGLPDKAVDESRERVRSAIRASGATVPAKRITINLGPAHLRKEGPAFDLPIAIGVLAADGQVTPPSDSCLLLGELALDGSLRPVRGVLPVAAAARALGITELIVPAENASEAGLVSGVRILVAHRLAEVIGHLAGEAALEPIGRTKPPLTGSPPGADFRDVRGQASAKRALEIAAAGGHNVLLAGPPGTGKTLLAKAMPGILPRMRESEMLEVTGIWSVAGLLSADQPLVAERPFRAPHHSVSLPALVGGGSVPKPGEISLAHRGVLYLDELPQFAPSVLEAIRGPLEDRRVRVSRSRYTLEYPSDCMVVASQNPCPCGFADDPERVCTCSPGVIGRYRQRVSGPIRDRFDLLVGVPRLPYETVRRGDGEASAVVRDRVERARLVQRRRYGSDSATNAGLGVAQLDRFCAVSKEAGQLIREATDRWYLSVRGIHRVLKVARTISDLAGEAAVAETAVAEALGYRSQPVTV